MCRLRYLHPIVECVYTIVIVIVTILSLLFPLLLNNLYYVTVRDAVSRNRRQMATVARPGEVEAGHRDQARRGYEGQLQTVQQVAGEVA